VKSWTCKKVEWIDKTKNLIAHATQATAKPGNSGQEICSG
jgi:hypothetical protein